MPAAQPSAPYDKVMNMPVPVIKSLRIGEYEVLTYLVACPRTGQAVIIDPAGEARRLAQWAQDYEIKYILNTHGHPDHTLANAELKELAHAPVAMHQDDDDFFASEEGRAVSTQELHLPPPPRADVRLSHGQALQVGDLRLEVIHTPGHTPGSVCFLVEGNLFTGDTLFVGAVGRTDLGGASLQTLLDSIEQRLLPLPDKTIIHPGHDYGDTPASTLGREREENPFITDFILDA